MEYRIKRNIGIITILVGVGLFFISIIFSTGCSSSEYSFIDCIPYRYILLKEGEYVEGEYLGLKYIPSHYEGRIAIPLKYTLSLSIVLILVGTGIVLLSKNKETDG